MYLIYLHVIYIIYKFLKNFLHSKNSLNYSYITELWISLAVQIFLDKTCEFEYHQLVNKKLDEQN